MNDREGATHLIKGKASKKVKKIWADMGYRGKQLRDLMKMKGKDLEIVQRPRRWFWVTQEQTEEKFRLCPLLQYCPEDGLLRELFLGLAATEE